MSDLLRFLAQVIVIVTVSHVFGSVLVRLGQPRVIGQVLGGIVLGPCFFGWLAPAAWSSVFPNPSLPLLNIVSQFGLIFFMFLVGLRLQTGHIQSHRGAAMWISAVSILAPYTAGVGLAFVIRERLAPAGVDPLHFAFFMGVAMSITAFPVLARILDETGLIRTPVGTMAIACAAVDDVTAWVLLSAGIALVRHGASGVELGRTLALLLAYVAAILVARPIFVRLASSDRTLSDSRLTAVLLACAVSAAMTEAIGVHALFGAFFIGLVMPKDQQFVRQVSAALQPVATLLLLPIFFAYTGLRMNVPSISARFLLDGLMILAVAALGKGGGALLAGRVAGMRWRDAVSLGALLNTRGLVELAVLNVGLDLHILSPALFSLMVVMALVTTAMAVPTLRFVQPGVARGIAEPLFSERASNAQP